MKRAAIAALVLVSAAAAFAKPSRITAEYRLTSSGLTIGRVTESFERNGTTYAIQSVTRTEGALKVVLDETLVVESTGKVNAAGLQPLEFGQRRSGNAARDIKAVFDWERGILQSSYKGATKEIALPPATQDRLSFLYQFMNLETPGARVDVNVSNGRKVDRYTYRFVDEVRLATPAGEFDTVHYSRVTDNARDSKAEVWLAKDRFNFPVRVVFDDPRGLRLEQTLVDLKAD